MRPFLLCALVQLLVLKQASSQDLLGLLGGLGGLGNGGGLGGLGTGGGLGGLGTGGGLGGLGGLGGGGLGNLGGLLGGGNLGGINYPDYGGEPVSFLGCFQDTSSRVLKTQAQGGNQSPQTCLQQCASYNMPVAGVEVGSQCFCGYPRDLNVAQQVDPSRCSSRCPLNNQYSCGGIMLLSVYTYQGTGIGQLPPGAGGFSEQGSYVGCFRDTSNRILKQSADGSNLSPQVCLQRCLAMNLEAAGVEAGFQCFCGSIRDLQFAQQLDQSQCNSRCPNNVQAPCGGNLALSVYTVGGRGGRGGGGRGGGGGGGGRRGGGWGGGRRDGRGWN